VLNIWEFPHRSRQSSYHTQFILTSSYSKTSSLKSSKQLYFACDVRGRRCFCTRFRLLDSPNKVLFYQVEPVRQYSCDAPVAETPTEIPSYDAPVAETPTEKPSYDEPATEAPLDEDFYDSSRLLQPKGLLLTNLKKAENTGSDFCVGIAPENSRSELVEATPLSTWGGDDRILEKLFVCCAQSTRMVLITTGEVCPFVDLVLAKPGIDTLSR
jgi:hypothetical protein